MTNKAVSVIGMGKLGAPFCAALASQKFTIFASDKNQKLKRLISKKKAPYYEAQLQEYLTLHGDRIKVVDDIKTAVLNSSITFIVVTTPSRKNGSIALNYVHGVLNDVALSLREKKDYHLIVLVSTVLPLSSNNEIIPRIEKISGKKCSEHFGYCYNPEFIALGSVIKNLLNPDMVLIGESDQKAGDILENFYRQFCPKPTNIIRMNTVNAEIAKISLNSYITMKISFANFLAELCEHTPGAHVDAVTSALGHDSRIGGKYLKGGLGFGGPCFPRDNRAISYFGKTVGVKSYLAVATDHINNTQVDRILQKVEKLIPHNSKISVLGLSYKPDTAVVEESQAIMIADLLSKKYRVSVYDPAALFNSKKILGPKVIHSRSIKRCIKNARAIILTTPWKEFENYFSSNIKRILSKTVLIDCWRIGNNQKYVGHKNYVPVGYYSNRKS